ncbi:MAG: serine/threonine-protein kinase, partial [Candidatus Binatia bacterium]
MGSHMGSQVSIDRRGYPAALRMWYESAAMECTACRCANRAGAAFCSGCGMPLGRRCPHCGADVHASARFCDGCGRSLELPSPSAGTPAPSALGGGRYLVRRLLGEGAKKRVYLAHDTRLERDVALAVIKTEGLDDAGLARVRREARAMGRLGDHPHVVTVYDVGDEDDQVYIVSQFMAGGSIEDLVGRAEKRQLPIEQVVQLADQMCRALEHAHGRSIVHRDVKPSNVWLTGDGTAKLGDFGLAVALDRSRLTIEGMMVGTVAYMPPEQALGHPPDVRSDLYGLGATIYEMLTGRPPFLGD